MSIKFRIASIPYFVWLTVFAFIPMITTAFLAFTNSESDFTLDNIFNVVDYSSIFLRSLGLAAVSTLICLIFGFPMALIISKLEYKIQKIMITLVIVPMWFSFLLKTYSWMTIFEDHGILNNILNNFGIHTQIINTPGAVIFGMVYNFFPYMVLPIYSSLSKADPNIFEAARDLGANRFQILKKIIFPLSFPGIISGLTMVFVPSVSTFIISKMLGGGAQILVGELIEMRFLGGAYNPNSGSALALVLMIFVGICIGLMNSFGN
jgi:spermidine/putrescine transport system permease protein